MSLIHAIEVAGAIIVRVVAGAEQAAGAALLFRDSSAGFCQRRPVAMLAENTTKPIEDQRNGILRIAPIQGFAGQDG
jgi:hypothetical protein